MISVGACSEESNARLCSVAACKLAGQMAVVTGASSGIGRAIAEALAAEGASLCLLGRRPHELREVAPRLREGAQKMIYRVDLSSREQIANFAANFSRDGGQADILIHSAGVIAIGALEKAPADDFDWQFNAQTIDRGQIEQLAACDFLRRKENLVLVGQSGLGKSRIIKAITRQACVLGYTTRYTTSGALFADLTAALADQTLPKRVRYYCRYDFLVIDEFGFDRLEREASAQAASLLYKIIDTRGPQRSTALVTNIDFDRWGEYLGDPPLAMAVLDRIVDGAIVLKLTGKSYRAHRAKQLHGPNEPPDKSSSKK